MKKLIAFIVVSIAMVSCYEEYLLDYPYTGIYFPNQMDVRTFVVGEGMQFKVGATLGGVRQNTVDRNVTFSLNSELITAARLASMQSSSWNHVKNPTAAVTALELLPASHYSLSHNSTMVIKSGLHTGTVTVKADSVAYLADSLKTCRISTYVLPFYITSADADTVLESRRYNVVGTMFENMLFGNYWHGGAARVSKYNQPTVDSATVVYRWAVNDIASKIWTLTTAGPSTLYTNGYYNLTTTKNELKLVLKGNNVYVSSATGSTNTYLADGPSTFNRSKLLQERKIFLKYKFVAKNKTYYCTDTLYFRNRLRDGVNEWQDEILLTI